MTNKHEAMALMNSGIDSNLNLAIASDRNVLAYNSSQQLSCWGYWQDWYYPTIIRESYPIYIRERAEDKGKQAFEIIKALQDKKVLKLDKVSDFIEVMDTLIKIL